MSYEALQAVLAGLDCDQVKFYQSGGVVRVLGSAIDDRLIEIFKRYPELMIFHEHIYALGNTGSSYSYHNLAAWLCEQTLNFGAEIAVQRLADFMAADDVRFMEIMLLTGIIVEREIKLSDDVALMPSEDVPCRSFRAEFEYFRELLNRGVFDDHQHMATWTHSLIRKVLPRAALVRFRREPKCFAPLGMSREERANFSAQLKPRLRPRPIALDNFRVLLTLVGPSAPLPMSEWKELADEMPMSGIPGGAYGGPNSYSEIANTLYAYTDEDHKTAERLGRRLAAIPLEYWEQIAVSIDRLNMALRRAVVVDKAIDLGVALESVLLGSEVKGEISYQFRLNGANLLGETLQEKEALLREFGRIYELRSKAAHEGRLKQDKKSKRSPAQELEEGIKLCARALDKILMNDSLPNWKRLALGGPGW